MAKRQVRAAKAGARSTNLFSRLAHRRRRPLFLQRYLAEEAEKPLYRDARQVQAFAILLKWADLEKSGHLARKETALDAAFLHEVFGEALGYRLATDSPEKYELERNFTVPGVGTADGALGNFAVAAPPKPLGMIELKSADTDLDRDRFNGRTPVQQCWDYLNALPECPWGIVSNFVSFRLYHRDKTPLAWEEFTLAELRDPKRFAQFYYLLEADGLVHTVLGVPPRALRLLEKSSQRQQTVSDILYEDYRANRFRLIEHLTQQRAMPLETAIHIAQKILDRIIFVAFCEDRGLLPARCIDTAYRNVPPFSKVTNPRWRNFLDLFQAIDLGHASLELDSGYNGGLFRRDPDVDDLQLDDEWTRFFQNVGGYDFRDEVTVDVLGHIFEKSIAELEALRRGGLYGLEAPEGGGEPTMPKSAERKRFGIYYTPPDFTRFLVRETVHAVIDRRLAALRATHRLPDIDGELSQETLPSESDERSPALAVYWRDALAAVRQVKICDPACGSGAFLIQAYDALEERYTYILDQLLHHDGENAEEIAGQIPEMILADNLYGVDLSEQAVEITQLALWIRSARRGRTLADLSNNIVCRNSLVTDTEVDPRAIDWRAIFPVVFDRGEQSGFDCVIGNPPWERLKLQEREFFAFSDPSIAGAVSAAARRKMIAALEKTNPDLYNRYLDAGRAADRTLAHVRASGNFPLTAQGDINTYMLFAELARKIVSAEGRVGLLVPSGICTDNTTRECFNALIDGKSLVSLYDFENRRKIFRDVDNRFKFCTLVFEGAATEHKAADFAFFCHSMDDLDQKSRHIKLSAADIALLNPNTRTCPIFRTRRDAQLTKAIYRNVPVLVDKSRRSGGNPWGVRFVRMFDQTNDAELFHARGQLAELGLKQQGNRWAKGDRMFLPLYEAKMVQAYDHRAASVVVASGNWVRQGQTEETSLVSHQNPEFVVQPRWWVEDAEVDKRIGGSVQPAYLCYKDVTSPTNQRTMIAALVPHVALVNSAPLMLTGDGITPRLLCCLLATLNSLAYDFVARQKVGGVHLNYFIVKQLPTFPPERYAERCPWSKRHTLEKWISDRALKLTCTADDMLPFAAAAGLDPPVHRWIAVERADLLAELDAAYFHLYGLTRDDVEYILTTFQAHRPDATSPDLFSRGTPILEAYDRLAGE